MPKSLKKEINWEHSILPGRKLKSNTPKKILNKIEPRIDKQNDTYAEMILGALILLKACDGVTQVEIWKVVEKRNLNREPQPNKKEFFVTLKKMADDQGSKLIIKSTKNKEPKYKLHQDFKSYCGTKTSRFLRGEKPINVILAGYKDPIKKAQKNAIRIVEDIEKRVRSSKKSAKTPTFQTPEKTKIPISRFGKTRVRTRRLTEIAQQIELQGLQKPKGNKKTQNITAQSINRNTSKVLKKISRNINSQKKEQIIEKVKSSKEKKLTLTPLQISKVISKRKETKAMLERQQIQDTAQFSFDQEGKWELPVGKQSEEDLISCVSINDIPQIIVENTDEKPSNEGDNFVKRFQNFNISGEQSK